jgi:hypothetical protein
VIPPAPGTASIPRGGWSLVALTAALVLAMVAIILGVQGVNPEGLAAAARATSRTSLALFLAPFLASSLWRLHRGGATGWLLRNRRYLGVSFAATHAVHGLVLLARYSLTPERPDVALVALGGIGYLFIAAMVATSFDRSAAWLGPARWRRLHVAGLYWIWSVFLAVSLLMAVLAQSLLGALMSALLVAALGLRLLPRLALARRPGAA